MRNFASGLFLGILFGVVGTIGVMSMGDAAPEAVRPAPPADPFQDADELAAFLDQQPMEIGFVARNLATGAETERFADRTVCLASMIKVFCLAELYRQKNEDGLDLEARLEVPTHGEISLREAADLMIGRSDNAATQALAEFLGREKVNAIPARLGLDAMSDTILPAEVVLRKILDQRIFGDRIAETALPQHGTARDMAGFYQLLLGGQVISEGVSRDLMAFFADHPKPFSARFADDFAFAGKGGNLLWTRPPKHYGMMGWGLFLTRDPQEYIVLCVWGEWFPEDMPPEQQSKFLKFVTDSMISIVDAEA